MVFFGMNHPKHFWMFKRLIEHFIENDLDYKIFVSEKDILPDLLTESKFEYIKLGVNKRGLLSKIIQMVWYTISMIYYSFKYNPNIWLGQALPHFAFASILSRHSKFYILEDTDHVSTLHKVTVPFCNKIFTTEKFPLKFGEKQVILNTYFELFYLHPTYFKSDNFVLDYAGINIKDKFALLRLVSWNAHHDVNESGIDLAFLSELISLLESKDIKVFITSEVELPEDFQKYYLKIKPIHIHSILKYAYFYIGEGATLAAEASLLGVSSIYINSLDTNYCKELAERYDLMLNFRNTKGVLDKVASLINDSDRKESNNNKLRLLLKDKIDPTPYFINLLQA